MNQRRQTSSSPARQLTRAVKSSKVPAISRAAAVLRLLGKSDAPLGVQAVARELGLVPSTCLNEAPSEKKPWIAAMVPRA